MCPLDVPLELDLRRYARLLGMAEVVSLRHHPGDLFRDLAPRLRAIVPFDFINFALCDPTWEIIKIYMWEGAEWPKEPMEIAVGETAVGWVWRNQSVLLIDDLLKEKQFGPEPQWLYNRDLRSYCVLPLTTPHEKIGAVGFGSKRPHAFSAHDVGFLHRVADMVALCIDNSLAEATLSLAPLVSAKGPLKALQESSRGGESFSPRDVELLKQVAATLVPVLERARTEKAPQPQQDQSGDLLILSKMLAPSATITSVEQGLAEDTKAETRGSFVTPESLREWEQLLTVYSNASQVGLGILDADFRYRMINNMLAKMNGLPAEAHLGKSLREVLGDSAELVEPYLDRVLATGQSVLNRQISAVLPGRTEPGHWIGHFIPIKDATGRVTQIGAVLVEITEQKKLEESFRNVSENLRAERKRAQVMEEVGRLLAAKWDVREIFPYLSAYLRRLLRQEYAALSLRDEKSGQLVRQAIDFPLRKGLSPGAEINAPKDPGGKAFQDRASLILDKKDMHGFKSGLTDHLLTEGLQSLCCVPLIRPKGPLGVLVLGSTRVDAFKTDDLTLLNQVAAQLAIALENAGTAREVKLLRSRLGQERKYLEDEPRGPLHVEGIAGESPALRKVLDQVAIVADSDATVLLLGETGTGKGLIARALHQASKRRDKAFVTLNCAAIPTGLLESELFGHEKGAFTGAVRQKMGRLELADTGTLFLDEIGEISSELQPKLLRVLQDHEFERLGGNRTIKVDLRLIAATNRDLAKSVAEKHFRSDLFYRLNVFPIRMPPLRERREDIPVLVRYFIRKFAAKMGRVIETVPSETMNALIDWNWSGNVRELENFIERSVILSEGSALQAPLAELRADSPGTADRSLESTEREHIIRVLRECGGIISGRRGAARRLGIKRTTLQSKMERLGITRQDYSDPTSE